MLTYIIKRVLAMIPTLIGISFVTFLIINLAPGDPVATSFGAQGAGAEATAGGGQNQDRLADAIKAKKKLLGMVKEDFRLHTWDAALFAGEQHPAAIGTLPRARSSEQLPAWARAFARLDNTIYAGGDHGSLVAIGAKEGQIEQRFGGHEEAIYAVALAADGSFLASGDTDGRVVLRSLAGPSSDELRLLHDSQRSIRDLLFTSAGLLTASDDGLIRLYELPGGTLRRTFEGHINGVYALAPAPDGQSFYSGGYDRQLRRWQLGTGQAETVFTHPQAINDIASSPSGRLATVCDDRVVRIFAPEGGAPQELRGHTKQATAVAFAPNEQRVFSGGGDETIRVWDPSTGAQIAQAMSGRVYGLEARSGELYSVAESWKTVPIWRRYLRWAGRLATMDFDRSFVDDRKVIEKLGDALPITVGLNVVALILIYIISIPIGILGAVRRGRAFDHVSSIILFILYSAPNFWLGTMLIMTFSSKQNWDILPSVGLHAENAADLSFLAWLWDWFLHLILPITVLTYGGFASLSRYMRTSMLEAIEQDYVRTARAKGLSEWIVVMKHAFRNALVTVVTLVANILPIMIGGSVIIEFIFSINGMGKLGFDAILARDYPVIMAITTFSALLTLVGILLSDIMYGVVDPRIRQE